MSPMVAMRTASEMASVETPSSAATSVIGTTRSSGRSSSAVDTTLASRGMRLAWLVSSAAACVTAAPSRPEATSCNWRWPLSFRNQKRMSGTSARLRPISSRTWSWVSLRFSFGTRLMTSVALRTSAPEPSTRPPLTNTLLTSGRSRIWRAIASVTARGLGDARARRQLDREQRCGCCPRRAGSRRAADRSCRSSRRRSARPSATDLVVMARPTSAPGGCRP